MGFDISHLVSLQSQLAHTIGQVDQLTATSNDFYQKGVRIYQRNLLFTAARALTIAYPVITKMLGEQAMQTLAKRMLKMQLPTQGDWGAWGNMLEKILLASELNSELPFLQALAQFEWQVHLASRAEHIKADLKTLNIVDASQLKSLSLKLQPHVTLLASSYPAAELWLCHRPWVTDYQPSSDEMHHLLATAPNINHALIYQQSSRVNVQPISLTDFALLSDIQSGFTIGQLIDRYGDQKVADQLQYLIQHQLLASLSIGD